MKGIARVLGRLAALAVFGVLGLLIVGKGPSYGVIASQARLPLILPETAPGTPEPAMERLRFYIGDWDYSEVYPKSTLFPNGGRSTGKWTAQLGPWGLSVVNAFASHGTGDNYEGMEIMTWDPKEKIYRDHAIWYDSPGQWEFTGRFEGDVLIYRGNFELQGKQVRFRSETRALKEGGFTLDEFGSVNGGKEEVILHARAEKK